MAKRLLPEKMIIEFEDGKFVNGVILYKVSDNGAVSKTKSIGIKNADFSRPVLNGLLQKFIQHAKTSEAIPDDMP